MGKTIAVDFDGVIHKYSKGWLEGDIYDEPVDGAFAAITKLIDDGFTVVIHTTREDHGAVRNWLIRQHYSRGGFPIPWAFDIAITNVKPKAIAYIDDRAVRFTNWDDIRKMFC